MWVQLRRWCTALSRMTAGQDLVSQAAPSPASQAPRTPRARGRRAEAAGSLDTVVLLSKLLVAEAKLVHEGGCHLVDLVLENAWTTGPAALRRRSATSPSSCPLGGRPAGHAHRANHVLKGPMVQSARAPWRLWRRAGRGAVGTRRPGRTHLLQRQPAGEDALHVLVLTRGVKVLCAHLQLARAGRRERAPCRPQPSAQHRQPRGAQAGGTAGPAEPARRPPGLPALRSNAKPCGWPPTAASSTKLSQLSLRSPPGALWEGRALSPLVSGTPRGSAHLSWPHRPEPVASVPGTLGPDAPRPPHRPGQGRTLHERH